MNRHKFLFAVALLFAYPAAAANEYACLKALIPATDLGIVQKHLSRYSLPEFNDSQSAIAIGEWKNGRLVSVFVYSEASSKQFDSALLNSEKNPKPLTALEPDWFKTHTLAMKLDTMEVFQIHPEPPPQISPRRPLVLRTTSSEKTFETGGWLVEKQMADEVLKPIRREIAVREDLVRNRNLNAERFRAWRKAQKFCPH